MAANLSLAFITKPLRTGGRPYMRLFPSLEIYRQTKKEVEVDHCHLLLFSPRCFLPLSENAARSWSFPRDVGQPGR